MYKYILICLTALSILSTTGCSNSDERKHPLYLKGEKARADGNAREAVTAFKELLKRKPESTYVHLQLASVYDELLDDPQQAALHYRLYLGAYPDAPDAEEVKAWMLRAEKRYYDLLHRRFASAAAESTAANQEVARLKRELEQLQKTDSAQEIARLKREIEEMNTKIKRFHARYKILQEEVARQRQLLDNAQQPAAATGNTTIGAEPDAPASGQSTYVVQEGDTPGRIALKLYGKSSKYKLILQANPGVTEHNLRPGMKLVIPTDR